LASNINLLNALCSNIVEISSSSYELSFFSSKADSGHIVGADATLEKSSSVSIWDLWLEINSTRGTGEGEGASMTATRGHLEASILSLLLGTRGGGKKSEMVDSSRDA
jgi:hypothetical protein